ncbi:hypothetical protein [Prochlorococcus marinus]|uniref:hypothetical protein n=1 Tax=Prochlorococcus TaxID=1218 RepID=UPI0007B3CBF5|nr:hypothetical protein [Prochlorococcus marinus]
MNPTEIINIEIKKKYKRKMYLEIARSAHLYKDICLDGEVNHMIAASCMIQGKEEDLIRILKEIHEQRQTCRTTALILRKISGNDKSKIYTSLLNHSCYKKSRYEQIDEHLTTIKNGLIIAKEEYIEIKKNEDIPCWPLRLEKSNEVLVVCWNASINAMGRAAVLCEAAIESGKNVELLGLCNSNSKLEIWKPILEKNREYNISIITYESRQDLFRKIVKYAKCHKYELVWASKVRYESLVAGIIYKVMYGTMIMADVDEFESSFNTTGIELSDARIITTKPLSRREVNELADNQNRSTLSWDLYAERMINMYDRITVASENLKRHYGEAAIVLRHVRNTNRQSKRTIKTRPEFISILFNGTIRKHKGVCELIEVLSELAKAGQLIELFLYEQPIVDELKKKNKSSNLVIKEIKEVRYSENIGICKNFDFICVPQNKENSISNYQTPAKISDAVIAEVSILSSNTPPIEELINNGIQIEIVEMEKESFLKAICNSSKKKANKQGESIFSVKSIPNELRAIIRMPSSYKKKRENKCSERVVEELEMSLVVDIKKEIGRNIAFKEESLEVVVLWRQADTGDYPRRQHAITRRLAKDRRIKQVHHFEPPVNKDSLDRQKNKERVIRRYRGIKEGKKINYNTYIYERINVQTKESETFKSIDWYPEFIEKRILRCGKAKKRILWIYPPYPEVGSIIQQLDYDILVVDIVDNLLTEHDPSSMDYKYTMSQYKYFANAADMIIVNCQPLVDLFENLGGEKKIKLVKNAYPEIIEQKVLFKGPIKNCIYTGNMNGRMDWHLLRDLSAHIPEVKIQLYGEANDNISWLIRDCPNIEWKGVISQDEIRNIFDEYSIAIVPHINNEKTRYMNPIKVYQYLSLGIPVITSCELNIPASEILIIAKTLEQFKKGLKRIEEYGAYEKDQNEMKKTFLQSNNWDSRMELIWENLNELIIN